MKLKLSILISLLAFIMFSSCDEAETFEDKWKLENEAQFTKISGNSEYTKLNSSSGKGFIMYKVNEEGDGNRAPYFTEQVKVRYTGWYKNIWTMPDTYNDDQGNVITNKVVFDTTSKSGMARTFFVNPNASSSTTFGVIDGFSTALQHMKRGDKWEVWIPWKLGYGEIGKGAISAHTTIVFEIELVEIVE